MSPAPGLHSVCSRTFRVANDLPSQSYLDRAAPRFVGLWYIYGCHCSLGTIHMSVSSECIRLGSLPVRPTSSTCSRGLDQTGACIVPLSRRSASITASSSDCGRFSVRFRTASDAPSSSFVVLASRSSCRSGFTGMIARLRNCDR